MSDAPYPAKLADLLVATARAKHAAALARRTGTDPTAEPPRQVYIAAVERIAAALAPHGFRLVKSGPRLTRTDGATRTTIFFQSDRNNVAGQHVRFMIHASVENSDLARWAVQSGWPLRTDGFVGGGQIGNLRAPEEWWSWEIADPATRDERIDDAIARIEEILLPFFARLSDPASLAEQAAETEIPGLDSASALRLCCWQLGTSGAERCLAFWLERYGRRGDFRAERDRVLAGGATDHVFGDLVCTLGTIAGAMRIGLAL